MNPVITASLLYRGLAEDLEEGQQVEEIFTSTSQVPKEAIEEFVSWVIGLGAGAIAALSLNEIPRDVDPDRDFDIILKEMLSLDVKIDSTLLPALRVALVRSSSYKIVASILDKTSGQKVRDAFYVLALSSFHTENPRPLLSEDLEGYF
jgi:hypothetical protein